MFIFLYQIKNLKVLPSIFILILTLKLKRIESLIYDYVKNKHLIIWAIQFFKLSIFYVINLFDLKIHEQV